MRYATLVTTAFIFLTFIMSSCERKTEDFQLENVSAYQSLSTGKFITYRLDSTVFTNFGRNTEIHSYDEKHIIDAQFTDNLGRISYRVFRFIKDTGNNESWKPSGTYSITPLQHSIEVTENNLRIVTLAAPVKLDYSWKGNRFLPDEPYSGIFNFSNDDYMNDWEFIYTGNGESLVLKNHTLSDVVTVLQADESINVPITTPTAYASINYVVEKYARGIGLVYQELEMWEYQPNPSGPSGYKTGFGIKRSMIDHN